MLKQAYGNTKLTRRLLWLAGYADALFLFTSCCMTASGTANLLWFLFILAIANLALALYAVSQGVVFEWFAEKNFKEVCKGLGFEAEVRSFKYGLWGAFVKGDKKMIQPNLRCVRGNGQAWTGVILQLAGQKVENFTEHAEAYALAFNVEHCSFERTPEGDIRIRCGEMPVPEMYAPVTEPARLVLAEPEAESAASSAVDTAARALLQGVPMAVDINGRWGKMPIEGRHWLIAGRSGAGKGSFIWQLVGGLELAHRAGLVRLWGCDPKRVELGLGRPLFDEYADTVEGIVELLEKAGADLDERNSWLQGRARKFTPSRQLPLNVIIMDELAYVSSMLADKKLATRAETAMKKILALGRSGGYSFFGAAQDPRKEVLGFRDYFHYRVALGLDAAMVDLVLGEGMQAAGAYCSQIPLEGAEGTAFIVSETSKRPVLVRAPWWSDEAILAMAARWTEDVQAAQQEQVYEQGYVSQLDFNGQPLSQFRYRLE